MSVENGRNVLVVYYSHDESTKSIAESIAGETNADLLELKPEYPSKMPGRWGKEYLISREKSAKKNRKQR